jgi:hypothetical protein
MAIELPSFDILYACDDQLLGWMHRKLRQNSNDVFKDFNNGGGTSFWLLSI